MDENPLGITTMGLIIFVIAASLFIAFMIIAPFLLGVD